MNFIGGVGAIVGGVIGGVVGLLLIIFVIWLVATYNNFVRLKNAIEEAFSTMDVYLKKRYDLVPNFVETVKGYAKHEKETLEKVIAARNACATAGSTEDKMENEARLTSVLKQLSVVIEKYPELKADKNFIELQNTLKILKTKLHLQENTIMALLNNTIQNARFSQAIWLPRCLILTKNHFMKLILRKKEKTLKLSFNHD